MNLTQDSDCDCPDPSQPAQISKNRKSGEIHLANQPFSGNVVALVCDPAT
jgi:hypothetical protein